VLRSGQAPADLALALAMGLSRSPMGHVQCDNGSLVLGTAGRWGLDDPGYQQYLRTAERALTLGPSAHNASVINGEAQRHKRPALLSATRLSDAPEVPFALVDLTACYPPEAGVTQVWRAVWLIGRAQLLVCDQVHARCEASPEHFQGALEYAFYLMVGGKKAVVHWYTPSPEVALPIPEAAGREPLEVRGFVREQAHPDKKRMLAVAVR
jgi:hypothetical protein